MTLEHLEELIALLKEEYGYTPDTLVHIKNEFDELVSVEGFFVGEEAKLFIK